MPRLAGAVLPEAGSGWFEALIITVCLSIAIASLGFNLRVVDDDKKSRAGQRGKEEEEEDSRAGQRGVQWSIVIPLAVASAGSQRSKAICRQPIR